MDGRDILSGNDPRFADTGCDESICVTVDILNLTDIDVF
jgi:hypothetical protein